MFEVRDQSERSKSVLSIQLSGLTYVQAVGAGQQDPPELPVLGGVVSDVAALHADGGALHRIPVFVHHEPMGSAVSLGKELD